ncbi:MAG TPA: DUF6025 family protein [Nakamurella sp.]
MRSPTALVADLGLTDSVAVADLSARRSFFQGVHLGVRDTPIGTLLDLLRNEPGLSPPRSGHIGNWENIVRGRSGATDFNQAICTQGYGYPLIFGFTQTETDDGLRGDGVYRPGSIARGDAQQALDLYTWDGRSFIRRDRERALFCPFVLAEYDGSLVPLTALHVERMRGMTPVLPFRLETDLILRHEDATRSMLTVLLEAAAVRPNPRREYADLIGHLAALDGTVQRCEVRRDGRGYLIGTRRYASTAELVDHALLTLRAVSDPDTFAAGIVELPSALPVVSHLLLDVLSAYFGTHYPDLGGLGSPPTKPFNAHLHWGARDMAGYPPMRRGYFVQKSTARSLRTICGTLGAHFPDVDPLCFLLLPASVFMLCPTTAHPRDAELVAALFRTVRRATPAGDTRSPEVITQAARSAVAAWLSTQGPALSPYFMHRFRPRGSVLPAVELPSSSRPVEPQGFRELTFRQAGLAVGALVSMMDEPAAGA